MVMQARARYRTLLPIVRGKRHLKRTASQERLLSQASAGTDPGDWFSPWNYPARTLGMCLLRIIVSTLVRFFTLQY